MELNLKDYCREGILFNEQQNKGDDAPKIKHPYDINSEEYYEYKLSGVVVHVGTAEYGHYYSYIDTKRS